jgi:cell wall-associated NlpC family hydrolase
MAYQSSSLSVLSYANGFTLWHYRTPDLAADIDNVGYFNDASDMLQPGDFVFVNSGLGSTPTHGVMVVVANDGGVDLANLTAFATANRD